MLKKSFVRLASLVLTLGLAACASNSMVPTGLDKVQHGMDKGEVLSLAGNPQHTFRANDQDHWVYNYTVDGHAWHREVIFEKGKVSGVTRLKSKEQWEKELEKTDNLEDYEKKAREHEQKSSGEFHSIDGGPDATAPSK